MKNMEPLCDLGYNGKQLGTQDKQVRWGPSYPVRTRRWCITRRDHLDTMVVSVFRLGNG